MQNNISNNIYINTDTFIKSFDDLLYNHGKFASYAHLWNIMRKKYAVIFDDEILYYTSDPISAYNKLIFNKLFVIQDL